jgi:hypothetical protein
VWEAEIRRTKVPGQRKQKQFMCVGGIVVSTAAFQKKFMRLPSQWKKLSVVVCTNHPNYSRKHKIVGP